MRRALILYLFAYYLLVAGAVATLWRSGLVAHLDLRWTLGAIAAAAGLGVLLALASRR